ncbi:MAG: fibronectin type III domain-containing protein, partial [Candidatus Electryonea clarkiae]|nr:fibronectin type III domain-containing protein [Candidatus Electryonea clarkiae]
DLAVVDRTGSFISLSWTDNASEETEYYVERFDLNQDSLNDSLTYQILDTLDIDKIAYIDNHVIHGNNYSYRVRAGSGSKYSDYSDSLAVYANAPPEIPYNPLPGDGVTDISTIVNLSWICTDRDDTSRATDLQVFNIYLDTSSPPRAVIDTLAATFRDTQNTYEGLYDLDKEMIYYWQITATDKQGEITESPIWSFNTTSAKSWISTFGDAYGDEGISVLETSDGGFMMIGTTVTEASFGSTDMWLIRTDDNGRRLWYRTFGGSAQDVGYSINATSDGGYILGGATRSMGAANYDMFLVKTDVDGYMEFVSLFGENDSDKCYRARQTSDGKYILVGESSFNLFIAKAGTQGEEIWTRTYGGNRSSWGIDVQETADGGFIIVGTTRTADDNDFDLWLVKIDDQGELEWDQEMGSSDDDYGYAIHRTDDGGFIILGAANLTSLTSDIWLIKTNSVGELRWDQVYEGSGRDWGYSLQPTDDGGYILIGNSEIIDTNTTTNIWMMKTDALGTEEWTQTYDSTSVNWRGSSVQPTIDGGYIITGSTEISAWLAKTDNWGNISQGGEE